MDTPGDGPTIVSVPHPSPLDEWGTGRTPLSSPLTKGGKRGVERYTKTGFALEAFVAGAKSQGWA